MQHSNQKLLLVKSSQRLIMTLKKGALGQKLTIKIGPGDDTAREATKLDGRLTDCFFIEIMVYKAFALSEHVL